ncbi:MAG TPA: substrate-binding domain-containing protein [Bryobacteraceae bacterium]|nr:substrate-binding domain-containing protein [Bryobacteraceae bacterium]
MMLSLSARALLLAVGCASVLCSAELHVIASAALTEAFIELIPQFEHSTQQKVIATFGSSVGDASDSIRARIERGERADLVILARAGLDQLINEGRVVQGTAIDLVRSNIGVAVRAGAPKPDITTVEALRHTLLQADSIAYSASLSGVYVSTELFSILGIADRIKSKTKKIEGERVGIAIARGDAEIGFQQISELLPITGIQYVGPLPPQVQRTSIFSAGILSGAQNLDAARAFIQFLASPAAVPVLVKNGLEPAVDSRSAGTPMKH